MFSLDETMRYYLYPYPADMRKSFYTLSGIVTNTMGGNVQSGDVFIFLNRTLNVIKLLHMECGGLVIYHMKLECGTFKLPSFDEKTFCFVTSWQDLMQLVKGQNSGKYLRKKRWEKV
jgi:hypothetical protein